MSKPKVIVCYHCKETPVAESYTLCPECKDTIYQSFRKVFETWDEDSSTYVKNSEGEYIHPIVQKFWIGFKKAGTNLMNM